MTKKEEKIYKMLMKYKHPELKKNTFEYKKTLAFYESFYVDVTADTVCRYLIRDFYISNTIDKDIELISNYLNKRKS